MNIGPEDLFARIASGDAPLILDVRSAGEFAAGHVPGARHMPFWAVPARAAEIEDHKEQPVVVYCGHGPRAHMAGAALRMRGFGHVMYLAGHMAGWTRAGLRADESGRVSRSDQCASASSTRRRSP